MTAPFSLAVSLYDKFEHLGVLHDIVRYNWTQLNDVPILISCNHADPGPHIEGLNINKLVVADRDLPWTQDGGRTAWRLGTRARTLDCIQRACKAALDFDTSYTFHTHACGWPLSVEKILEIIDYMKANGKVYASGGLGLSYHVQRPGIDLIGELDDYFFIIDNDFAREVEYWDFHAKTGDPVQGHQWYLVTRFLEKSAPKHLHLYQDYKSGGIEFGGKRPRDAGPWRYDDTYKMFHVDDFAEHHQKIREVLDRNAIREGSFVRRLLDGKLKSRKQPRKVQFTKQRYPVSLGRRLARGIRQLLP